ncbi:DUF7544 domain-containing protein [Kitasatospora viridis]|uniref:Glycerophosphoryl diester phosphodiesterase family protein n=1 Tax=Kitasatospora viridis TaxID=281105 RepID=A0A561UK33_9ACTN|nr:glycerophosphoryl diester phosphodiesterase membrane domain-containing protein [Kitasatospora viridis]TWF99724.1 glycerophosphoryl diester phosphodiesterase family protein [Kitasatospora viridis]
MTDTPGWVSPGSSPSDPEDGRAPASAPAAPESPRPEGGAGTSAAPADATAPAPAPAASAAPPYAGAYGQPGAQVPPQQGFAPPPGWGRPPHQQQVGWGQPGWSQPGWGQPGWQPQWGSQPLTPKPGVIPLRPLGVGEILDGAITTSRKHWRTVLPLSLGVAVLTQGTSVAIQWYAQSNDTPGLAAVLLLGVGFLISAVASLVMSALLTMVVSKAILGEPVTAGAAWRAARPQFWRLLGLSLLIALICVGIVVLGLLPALIIGLASDNTSAAAATAVLGLLVAGLVATWMYVRLSLATPALMLEKQGIKAALARSRKLTRDSWWRIFGISVLGVVLTAIIAGLIAAPFTIGAGVASNPFAQLNDPNQPVTLSFLALLLTGVGGVLGATITVPVRAGINVLLYVDQRIRREALDLELARAAGLPEYGGTGWAGQPGQPPTGAA